FSKYFVKESIKEFNDLANHAWAEDAIEIMGGKGIINGVDETHYNPAANISRAEFCAIVTRMFKYAGKGSMPFGDVTADKWYYKEVLAAYENNLINGKSADTLDPNGLITRQEIAKIVAKVLEHNGYIEAQKTELDGYTDYSGIAAWAKDGAAMVIREGIISGIGGNQFAPNKNASRAETAVILYRLYDLLMK
ncbi:MAG: S-layer homology domain-containing protein, partial [Clostridia bacterium]|nr:S-layer homology domain-containing protein [Clostridia bacterium]